MNEIKKVKVNVMVSNDSNVMSFAPTAVGYEEKFNDLFFIPHMEERTYHIDTRTGKVIKVDVRTSIKYKKQKTEVMEKRKKFFTTHSTSENYAYMSQFEPKIY